MSRRSTNPFMNLDWLETQKQYMEAWKSFGQLMTGDSKKSGANGNNPWADAMDAWWNSVSAEAPSNTQPFVEKMLEQGKMFYMLSEQFTTLLQNINDLNKASDEWQSQLNAQFDQIKQFFDPSSNQGAMHGMLGAWQLLPMDTLQRTFSSSSIMPGDFLEEFKPQELQQVTDKFLSMPGVGYTRESQEQFQEGIRLWAEYQRVSQEYNHALSRTAIDAIELMRIRIIEMANAGEEINSLRQIYDLWVDCNEETYARLAYDDEFSELYGRVTNALMGVKSFSSKVVDETMASMHMPTRKGMSTMQKRQQELRRSYKEANRKIESLEEELAQIKQQLNSQSGGRASGSKKKTAKKAAAKKAAGKKAKTRQKPKPEKKAKAKKKSARKKASRKKGGDDMITIKI